MSTVSPQEQFVPTVPVAESQAQSSPETQAVQEVPPRNQEEAELLEVMKKAEGDEGAVKAAEAMVDQATVTVESQAAKKLDDVLMQAKDLAPDVADVYRDSVQRRMSEVKAAAGRTKDAIKGVLAEATKALKVEEKKLGVMEQAAATGKHGTWAEQKVEEQRQRVEAARVAVLEATPVAAPEAAVVPVSDADTTQLAEPVAVASPVMEMAIPVVVETANLAEPSAEEAAMAAGNVKSLDVGALEAVAIPLVRKEETTPIPLVTKKEAAVSAVTPLEGPKFSREEIKKQQEEWRAHLKSIMEWRKDAESRKESLTKSQKAYYDYSSTWEAVADAQEALAEAEGKIMDALEAKGKEEAEFAEVQEQLAAKFEERYKMYEQQNAYNKQAQDLEKQAEQPDLSEEKRAKIAYDMKRVRGEQAVLRSHIEDIGHEMQSLETDRGSIEERLKAVQSTVETLSMEREVLVKEKTSAEATEQVARTAYEAAEALFKKEAAVALAAAGAAEVAAAHVSGEKAVFAAEQVASIKQEAYEMGKDDKLYEEKVTLGDVGVSALRNSALAGAGAVAGGVALAGGVIGARGLAKVGKRIYAGFASIFFTAADLLDDLRHGKANTFTRWKKGFSDNIRDHGLFRGMWRGAGEVAFGSYDKRMEELDAGTKAREREAEEKRVKAGGGSYDSGPHRSGSSGEYSELMKTDVETKEQRAERQKQKFISWAKRYGGSAEWVEGTFTFDGETIAVAGDLDFRVLSMPVDPTKATSFDGVLKVGGKVLLSHEQRLYERAFASQGLAVEVEPEPVREPGAEPAAIATSRVAQEPPKATGGAATAT